MLSKNKSKRDFYYQVYVGLLSGLSLQQCLLNLRVKGFTHLFPLWLKALYEEKATLNQAMAIGGRFQLWELQLIAVGEKSGRLVEIFQGLHQWYEDRINVGGKIFVAVLYPCFLIALLPLFVHLKDLVVGGSFFSFLWKVFLFYLPFLFSFLFLFLLLPHLARQDNQFGRMVERFLFAIPVIGKHLREKYSRVIIYVNQLALKSGMGVRESLAITEKTTDSPNFRKEIREALKLAYEGKGFADFIHQIHSMDENSRNMIISSESAGKIPETLEQIYRIKTNEFAVRSVFITVLLGILMLLLAGGLVGYQAYQAISQYVSLLKSFL